MSDRSAALGLLLLAAMAWTLPPFLRWTSGALRPAPAAIFLDPGTRRLSWSPRGANPDGLPGAEPGGWEGLLLGVPLDLNRAGQEDLEALPSVGPKTAAAILAVRAAAGGFRSEEDLLRVPGIGPKHLEELRPLVRVEAGAGD